MAAEITVDIDQTGETKVSVKGVAGKSCRDVTKAIEESLGAVTSTEDTREASLNSTAKNTAKQR